MKFRYLSLMLGAMLYTSQAAQITEDTVRVTGSRIIGNAIRPITVITSADLRNAPVTTVTEALAMASGVDVQMRGMPGAQADITIRGGMFEQVLVLVDGVRMNSAQTGHLHGDLPVALGMIDRIEVLPGQGASVYGADAANGVINIITKNSEDGFSASLGYGEYGTLKAGVLLGVKSAGLHHTVCVERARSDGYRYDTGFENTFVNLKSRGAYTAGTYEAALYYGDRTFGAYDFYTPGWNAPSKEWTRTKGLALMNRHCTGSGRIESSVSVREQYDHFVFTIEDPTLSENEHTVRYFEAESYYVRDVSGRIRALAGANISFNHLASTKLKDRHQQLQALFSEVRYAADDAATVTGGLRFDNTGRSLNVSPSVTLALRSGERSNLFLKGGMATRTPSYTELYYSDPGNFSDASLTDEQSASIEAGGEYRFGYGMTGKLTLHATRYTDYIDWVGAAETGPWQASNLSTMTVAGIEPELRGSWKYLRATLRTSHVFRDITESYISKYAFRFPEHAAVFSGCIPLGAAGAELALITSFRKRSGEDGYVLADARFRTPSLYRTTLHIDVKNIFNTHYEDVPGVSQPGRLVLGGIEYSH